MCGNIEVSLFRESDMPGLKDIQLQHHWTAHPYGIWEEDFRWKFFQNPLGESIVVVAREKGAPIGMMALMPAEIAVGKNRYRGGQAVDLLVDRRKRRKGIFGLIGRELYRQSQSRGMDILYCVSNELGRYGHLKMGWFDIASWKNLIFPVDRKKTIANYSSVSPGTLARRLRPSTVRQMLFSNPRKTAKNVELEATDAFDSSPLTPENGISVAKSKEYLAWRYLERPENPYLVEKVFDGGEEKGYIVTCKRKDRLNRVYLIDWVPTGACGEDIPIAAFRESCKIQNATTGIIRGSPGETFRNTAVSLGMVDSGPAPDNYPLCRVEDGVIEKDALKTGKWVLYHGDTDHL